MHPTEIILQELHRIFCNSSIDSSIDSSNHSSIDSIKRDYEFPLVYNAPQQGCSSAITNNMLTIHPDLFSPKCTLESLPFLMMDPSSISSALFKGDIVFLSNGSSGNVYRFRNHPYVIKLQSIPLDANNNPIAVLETQPNGTLCYILPSFVMDALALYVLQRWEEEHGFLLGSEYVAPKVHYTCLLFNGIDMYSAVIMDYIPITNMFQLYLNMLENHKYQQLAVQIQLDISRTNTIFYKLESSELQFHHLDATINNILSTKDQMKIIDYGHCQFLLPKRYLFPAIVKRTERTEVMEEKDDIKERNESYIPIKDDSCIDYFNNGTEGYNAGMLLCSFGYYTKKMKKTYGDYVCNTILQTAREQYRQHHIVSHVSKQYYSDQVKTSLTEYDYYNKINIMEIEKEKKREIEKEKKREEEREEEKDEEKKREEEREEEREEDMMKQWLQRFRSNLHRMTLIESDPPHKKYPEQDELMALHHQVGIELAALVEVNDVIAHTMASKLKAFTSLFISSSSSYTSQSRSSTDASYTVQNKINKHAYLACFDNYRVLIDHLYKLYHWFIHYHHYQNNHNKNTCVLL